MSSDDGRPKPPEFLLDAELGPAELELVSELSPLAAPELEQRARLLAAVEAAPLRYAPFFDRLRALWEVPEATVVETLRRTRDERGWRRAPLPGVAVIDVPQPGAAGRSAYLVRFAAGLRYPKHRHAGLERVVLLEGGYRDTSGTSYGPGDLHEMTGGSEHGLFVDRDGPCICGAVEHGFEFTGPVLGTLQRLLRRRAGRR